MSRGIVQLDERGVPAALNGPHCHLKQFGCLHLSQALVEQAQLTLSPSSSIF